MNDGLPHENSVKLFISYSHTDKSFMRMDSLLGYINGLHLDNVVEIWYDKNILAGRYHESEIKKAISESQIALLLISQHWIDSVYVRDHEISLISTKAEDNNLFIIPVLLYRTDMSRYVWLEKRLHLPRIGPHLTASKERSRRRIDAYLDIREEIKAYAKLCKTNPCDVKIVSKALGKSWLPSAEILAVDARRYREEGRIADALFIYDRAIEAAHSNDLATVDLLIEVGEYRFKTGSLPYSLKYSERALTIASAINNDASRSGAMTLIGNVHRAWGSLNTAIAYYTCSLQLAPDDIKKARINMYLANAHYRLGDYNNAISILNVAHEALRNSKENRYYGIACGQLSLYLIAAGNNHDNALKYALEGLSIAEKHDDNRGVGFAKHRLGRVQLEQENISHALENFEFAYATAQEFGDIREVHAILIDQGKALYRQGNHEDAERCLYGSMMIGDRSADVFWLGQSHYCLGKIRCDTGLRSAYFFNVSKRLFNLCGAQARANDAERMEENAQTEFPDGAMTARERATSYLAKLGLGTPFSKVELQSLIANR